MAPAIAIVRTVAALRERVHEWRAGGARVGLVPTMGGLHEGHLALVRCALAETGRTCVSIFVNPRQFDAAEDFAGYPRDEAGDAARLAGAGAQLLFAPSAAEMYPQNFATRVTVGGLGEMLEGACRAGFFTGVATVVTKLLCQVHPDVAYFGEKDYQQLVVVRRLVADLDIPVRIAAVPTVRAADGLALSSRNASLTRAERRIAPALYRTLCEVAAAVRAGATPRDAAAAGAESLAAAGFAAVDYVSVRDARTLAPLPAVAGPARVLGAARLGRVRLIDNVAV